MTLKLTFVTACKALDTDNLLLLWKIKGFQWNWGKSLWLKVEPRQLNLVQELDASQKWKEKGLGGVKRRLEGVALFNIALEMGGCGTYLYSKMAVALHFWEINSMISSLLPHYRKLFQIARTIFWFISFSKIHQAWELETLTFP